MFLTGHTIDADIRYRPLVRALKDRYQKGETILEMGSGDYGLTPYFAVPIDGADIQPAFTALKSPLVTPMIIESVTLPVADSSYDYVVSVDMLEHVTKEQRVTAINEMIRVARKMVLIAVPTNKASEDLDAYLDKRYYAKHGRHYPFLKEHLEYKLPTTQGIIDIAGGNKKTKAVSSMQNANLGFRKWYMNIWLNETVWSKALLKLLTLCLPLYEPLVSRGECYRTLYIIEVK